MIDTLSQLKTIALTALFNPMFLALLLILFFAGKFFGKLTKRLNIWKILLLAYFGLFLYVPVRDAGPILGGIFLLGMASNHTRLIFSIFGWAQNLSDVIYAFRYRRAFEDIRRREQERQAHEESRRAYAEYDRQSQQRGWQDEAREYRQKPGDAKTGRSGAGQKERPRAGRKAENGSQGQRTNQQQSRTQRPPAQNTTRDKHLQALGLKSERDYSVSEIKKAYRKAVMKAHPDAGGNSADFMRVMQAYDWFVKHSG